MEIHVLSFKGIPEVGFFRRDELAAYLKKEGMSLEKVRVDMENNLNPDLEVYSVEVKYDTMHPMFFRGSEAPATET